MTRQPTSQETLVARAADKPPRTTTYAALIAITTAALSLGFLFGEERRVVVVDDHGADVVVNGMPLTKDAGPDKDIVITLVITIVTGLYSIGERLWRHLERSKRRAAKAASILLALAGVGVGAASNQGCASAERNGERIEYVLRSDPARPAPACLYRVSVDGDVLLEGAIAQCPAVPVCEEPK